ncbi:MAG: indole-3-pyruvate monooxygenase [Myxococcales bacterium]|jgi:cation diffusion facilitator CzcD-associated flavoprotein CzcO|nr:indole-3-pyruvate monooxygenase [Myxococcales bacterium]
MLGMEGTGTIIVGAGPAGLAVAACLRRAGRPFVVLEQSDDGVGASWRGRYRRLHLHTAKQHSGLPHLPFPRHHPRYPSREQVIEYLDLYRRHFEIEPRFGQRVVSIAQGSDDWWSTTTADGVHRSRHVVVCTGRWEVPQRPHWPGEERFSGEIVHSSAYSSAERFAGKRVLVVGLGNSGGEIAVDLAEQGAQTEIAVRSPVNVVPLDFLGMPIQRATILISFLPLFVRDWIGRLVSRLAFGDLRALGLPRPQQGPMTQIVKRGRIPLIDVGTLFLVRQGKIRLRPNVQQFEGGGAIRFVDGNVQTFDAVVLATGYDAGVPALLAGLGVTADEAGGLRQGGDGQRRGLFFVGFTSPPTGLLRQIAIEAKKVAKEISATA